MSYTPVELRHVRVARGLRGYKREAVEQILADVAESFETVWRERHELADRIEAMDAELARLRERDHALTQTLVAAEQAATHVKDQAKVEAETILNEARTEARAITRDAQRERARLEVEARRIEAILRSALAAVEETPAAAPAAEPAPAPPIDIQQPQQPQLRKVSGGFDWGWPKPTE